METRPIVTPVPAATVMLVRDGADGMEVFMVVRHEKSDVHAGALVFPGGRVDPEDHELARDARVFPPLPGIDGAMAALRVAAIRETFEECGVLLARAQGESTLVGATRLGEIEARHREPMMKGARSFGAILSAERLVLASDAMAYFANWITPERRAKRFDTHFFVASAPPDQVALHDGHEAVDSVWITPGNAIERARAGVYHLRFPTQMNLQKLGRHTAAQAALAAARVSRVVPVMSRQAKVEGGVRYLSLPLEADYGGELFPVIETPGASD
jgi:8-oxo-dGTP pyrophosphatase MutT (NUDIX family)